MKKERFLKRLFSVALGFLMLFASVVLVACKESGKEENAERKIYLLATDFSGKKHRIEQGETLVLEYDRSSRAHYWWDTVQAYYCDTNKEYTEEQPTRTFHDTNVDLLTPDEYICIQQYPKIDASFYTIVRVNENRPLPDFDFIAGEGCIDFVKNEKYVYKYDGKMHVPDFTLTYQGEYLGHFSYTQKLGYDYGEVTPNVYIDQQYMHEDGKFRLHSSLYDPPLAEAIGVYKIELTVIRFFLPRRHQHTFREIRKTIIIEIVE